MIDISFFRGAKPKIQPHLLEMGEAVKAVNCRLQSGGLKPFRGSTIVRALANPSAKTLSKYGTSAFWFEFAGSADVVEGPIASDTESTMYFTGDGLPAMTYASIATSGSGPYPSNRYTLGIPAPIGVVTAAVSGTATGGDELADSRSYVFTYVSSRGEEGPPSNPTSIVDVLEGQTVTLSGMPSAPTGDYSITSKRIYRTSTANGDTEFLFVGEINVANSSYTDTLSSENLGEVLPSIDWVPPPGNMVGLTSCGNGVLAGFYGKDIYFSEPYLPHAWPYSLTLNSPIVGIVSIRGGLVVATESQPVIISFTHPSAAAETTIESPRACVSKRSIVDMGEYALYATPDGLVAVDGAGNAPLITQNIIERYQWEKMNPHTIHSYRLEDWYVAFYQGDDGNKGFAISASGENFVELDFYADAGYADPGTASLFLAIEGNIVKWDDDEVNTHDFEWRSGTTLFARPVNMSAGRVDAEGYPVEFSLYDDDSLLFSRTVNDSNPFWIPANYLARRLAIQLSGSNTVRRVVVAESMEELS
jgi:hypothetical protein